MLSVAQLLDLWHGDGDSFGYASAEIASAVAEVIRPVDEVALRARFYPALAAYEIPDDMRDILDEGFRLWCHRAASRKRH